jgi:hypothetical protein
MTWPASGWTTPLGETSPLVHGVVLALLALTIWLYGHYYVWPVVVRIGQRVPRPTPRMRTTTVAPQPAAADEVDVMAADTETVAQTTRRGRYNMGFDWGN